MARHKGYLLWANEWFGLRAQEEDRSFMASSVCGSGTELPSLSPGIGSLHWISEHTLEPVEKTVVGIFKVLAQQ